MHDVIIEGAKLAGRTGLWDVGIKNERISFVCASGNREVALKRIQANERYLLPGLIDAHVHTRDPGYTEKEDFYSAGLAAANGGITSIMAMPNTNPPMTSRAGMRLAGRMAEKSCVNVYLVGGVCISSPGWIHAVARENAVALDMYDDIFSCGTDRWIHLLKEVKKTGLPIGFYLMDPSMEALRRRKLAETGADQMKAIQGATNGETEAVSLGRLLPMTAYFQIPVIVRMISTAKGLEMIRHMRRIYPDALIYAEVCASYLFLNSEALEKYGSRAHIHPPLRDQEDVDALWQGIQDGAVDYIASDHAPHTRADKNKDSLAECASGIAGIETMLALLLDASSKGMLKLEDIQRLCCENPARIYGLKEKGRILPGYDADLVLIDKEGGWTVDGSRFFTRGAPGPFEGWHLRGRPLLTMCKGKILINKEKNRGDML